MSVEPIYWQIAISALGIGIQIYIAERSRRQTAKQAKDSLDMQRLVSHRSTASFVADKRQKWIDELRTDMAFHLALSQEMAWKWDAVRSRADIETKQAVNVSQEDKSRILQDYADSFSIENGARDREHQERHIRIKFRLNPNEELHIELRKCLDEIRDLLNDIQGAKSKVEAAKLVGDMKNKVSNGAEITEKVLKYEWSRVKQEVAYPDALMATIPEPKE